MYLTVRISSIFRALALCLPLLFGAKGEGYGQRIYADLERHSNSIPNGTSITNESASVSSNLADYTRLSASPILTSTSIWQQLIFSGRTFSANSTVYIRVNTVGSLLGGSIKGEAYSGSNGNSNGTLMQSQATIFTSVDGTSYLAVTSTNGSFNAVRVTLSSPALAGTSTADIFYAFYEPTNKVCAEVLGTGVGGTGISLGGGVANPLNAVDNNLNTYSSLNGGILGLGYTISQTAYFSNLSNIGDAATITFSLPPSLLQLSLFNNININLYNGTTLVNSGTIGGLLSLDLLGLLRSGQRYTVSYAPGNVVFDRIEVSMATGVALLSDLRIHEIQRTPAKPIVPIAYPSVETVCFGNSATLRATTASEGSVLRWYNQLNDGPVLLEGNTYTTTPVTINVGDTAFYYVAAAWASGCPAESQRVKVAVVANPLPTITLSSSLDMCQGDVSSLLFYTNITNDPTHYSIAWSGSPDGFVNVNDAALPLNNITLTIPISAPTGTYTGILRVKNIITNCESEGIAFSIVLHPKPNAPNLEIITNSQY